MRVKSLYPGFVFAYLCLISINLFGKTLAGNKEDMENPVSEIRYEGRTITLNEKALYINAKLNVSSLGKYSFKSLQDAAKFARDGTSKEPTVIYLEPDVYWTDDASADNKENKLIGLTIPQANITLIGLSSNPEHTIIAGNRGQMAGAVGNWNTLGVGDGFKAYNVTFGNYCNVDLVYPLDSSKNRLKRQETITQAQVLTTAHSGEMDKWIFKNCRFISFLNVFAAGREPHRAYFKDCFFQCTDDAIGSGDISVFECCYFEFYANHPSWGGSKIIQAYLGCDFKTVLRDPKANPTIYFAKNNAIFAVIDCHFSGNATALEWTDILSDEARHYVYNNSLNGQPVMVSPAKPELSVLLSAKALEAFKIGNDYNIFNLLRGDDEWDPAEQKSRFTTEGNLPFRLSVGADKALLDGAKDEQVKVSYSVFPRRLQKTTKINWTVSDPELLTFEQKSDSTLIVSARNKSDQTKRAYLKGITAQGTQAVAYFDITGIPLAAPKFTKRARMGVPEREKISLDYELGLGGREDQSLIDWYRARLADGSDTSKVALSRGKEPLRTYNLSSGDTGFYLIAKIRPRHSSSVIGVPQLVRSRVISKSDIQHTGIVTDFRNLPSERTTGIKDGFWTLDTHRPADLSQEYKWKPFQGDGWTYGEGNLETAGRYGLYTSGRGARILYAQDGKFGDMHLALELSPQKAAGQGFGSATGQYLDIYTKFDPHTLSGYGLRIERTPRFGNGVSFALYKFENGSGTALGPQQYSSAFLSGCKIDLYVENGVFRAEVSTSSPQQQSQKDNGLLHQVSLSAPIEQNSFGGFGVQHTGSVGGSRIILERLEVKYN